MRGIKNISFKGLFVGTLVLFAAAVCVCFAGILFLTQNTTPHGVEEYYLDVSGLAMTDGLVVLSPSDFQKRLVSAQELGTMFYSGTRTAVWLMLCAIIILTVIWGIILYKIYSFKIFLPVKRLSAELENMACAGTDGDEGVKTRQSEKRHRQHGTNRDGNEGVKNRQSEKRHWQQGADRECDEGVKNDEIEEFFGGVAALPQELACLKQATDMLLENVSAAYSDFAHLGKYVSHEYKNTMALLRAKAQNGNMDGITRTVDKLVKDMDDILTLCAGRGQGFDEVVDLALVCGTAVDEYAKGEVGIEFSFDEECDAGVRGNELWIYRAVCNLIDNAVKYGKNGTVYVEVGVKNDCPFLEVSDTGIGIDREEAERIFDEGYRIGELKKDGYGIGLSLVKHVAWLCNAFLWVRSEKNVGSRFKMVFPKP